MLRIYRRKVRGKTSEVYTMDFMFEGRRVCESTKQTNKDDALRAYENRIRELRNGTAGIKKVKKQTFSEAAEKWTETKKPKWSVKMQSICDYSLGHLTPDFGKKLLTDIDASDIAKYQKQRKGEGASNRTINIEVGILRQIMKRFGAWDRVKNSLDWQDTGMLNERKDVGRALTASEEALLLCECGKSASRSLLPFVTLLLETGARFNTIRTLRWKQVDFAQRRITIGKDKTEAGTGRVIPLSSRATSTLELWVTNFPDRKPAHFVFPSELYGLFGEENKFGGEVKVRKSNPATPVGTIRKAWESAKKRTQRVCLECKTGTLADHEKPQEGFYCVDCGFESDDLPEGLTKLRLHDLRHSAVSRMVAARVPLPTIAKIVGWSRSTTVAMASRYAHPAEDEMRAAVEAISGVPAQFPSQKPDVSTRLQ